MPTTTVNDQLIFFSYRKGKHESPCSLILIHGAGGSHLDWPPELRSLADFDVYAVDLPGHGRSHPPGCSTINEYTEIITSFINKLKIRKVILVGHSMGGAIVQEFGLLSPSPIIGLVLVASGARLRVAPAILNGITADYEKTVDTITELAWSENAPVQFKQLGKQMLLSCDPATILGDFLACDEFNNMENLRKIEQPTLVICGTRDRLTPLKYSQFLAEDIPNSRIAVFEGAGHMVMLEEPGPVASVIVEFANNLDAGLH